MKTYKTWEVIKMLTENENLKFKNISPVTVTLFVGNNGFLDGECDGHRGATGNVQLNGEWALVQQPVSFMEAMEHLKKGGIAEYEGYAYFFSDGTLYNGNFKGNERTGCAGYFRKSLMHNKWYLREGI